MKSFATTAVAALGLIGSSLSAHVQHATSGTGSLAPIVIKGSKFFDSGSGEQFFMKGVAYQADLTNATSDQQFVDPLTDPQGCARDVPLLQALDTNVVRVYAIDTKKDHGSCMKMLDAAGIYVIADLSEPGLSINRDSPAWDASLYDRYTEVIDLMQQYNNVLGFFAGNEVTNNLTNTDASPFVKAAVRDMKAYIKSKGYRKIPVGYATNDDEKIRNDMAAYFNCGDQDSAVDFWGYNIYSWCGQSSLQISGWDLRTEEYANYSVPVFMAEYGCNTVQPRKFTEVAALYGSVMSPVWSGGIVYMYFEEVNHYGLVDVENGQATKLVDYTYYQGQITKVTPSSVKQNSYNPTNTAARACPKIDSIWKASTALPPTPDEQLCSCAQQSFSCVPADGLSLKSYGDLFGFICGKLPSPGCDGISTNGTTGSYGSYSMCSAEIRLGWALNAYYNWQNTASDACDFGGQAQIVNPSSLTSSCQSKISDAGGPSGTSSGGGSDNGGDGSDSKNAASAMLPSVEFAVLNTLLALAVSFVGGFGFFLM